jgi:vacuolar-type H+-ATPase subunit H
MAKNNEAMQSFQEKMRNKLRAEFLESEIDRALAEAGKVLDNAKRQQLESLLVKKIDQAVSDVIAKFIS